MADLPDTETSTVGRNAEFNEVVKCVVIVIKIKFNGLHCLHCRVTECCVGCRGCRVTERGGCRRVTERRRVTDCVVCMHCLRLGRGCMHCLRLGRGCLRRRVTDCVVCMHCLRLSRGCLHWYKYLNE